MIPKKRCLERGQALVEIALVFLILIPVVMVIVDLGRAVYYYSVAYNAAREGARAGIIPDSYDTGWGLREDAIRDAVMSKAIGIEVDRINDIVIDGPNPEPGVASLFSLTVSVTTSYQPVTPLIENIIGTNTIVITGVATMTMEK